MAYKIQLRLAGGVFSVPVTAKQAVEKQDKDTKLVKICCGLGDPTPPGKVSLVKHGVHAPVRPKQTVACPVCKKKAGSWQNWPSGKDNDDGTFTPVPGEVLESAAPGENLTRLIDLTLHPLADIERRTLPSGRFYNLEPGKEASATYPAVVRAVERLLAKGRVLVTRYAVVSSVSQYRLVTIGKMLAFQELAMGDQINLRPEIDFPEPAEQQVELLVMAAELAFAEYDPALYPDMQQQVVAKALAELQALPAGAAAATPVAAAPAKADPFAGLTALLQSTQKAPHHGSVSEVAATVTPEVAPEKPAPKKRAAPRKKAAAKTPEKVPA